MCPNARCAQGLSGSNRMAVCAASQAGAKTFWDGCQPHELSNDSENARRLYAWEYKGSIVIAFLSNSCAAAFSLLVNFRMRESPRATQSQASRLSGGFCFA